MPVEILSMDFIASPPHGTDGIVIMCRLSDTSIRALIDIYAGDDAISKARRSELIKCISLILCLFVLAQT